MTIGHSIDIQIDWRTEFEGVPCSTLAGIAVAIDGLPVWPVPGEVSGQLEWYADELLSHLTECWKPLMLHQTYPGAVRPSRPTLLRAEAEKRWAEMPTDVVELEEERIAAFEDIHNLANAFGGVFGLPPLWFFREGARMIVDAESGGHWVVPFEVARDALVRSAEEIATRLEAADRQKWSRLVSAWHRRDEGEGMQLLVLATGLDRVSAQDLVEERVLEPPASMTEAVDDDNELRDRKSTRLNSSHIPSSRMPSPAGKKKIKNGPM